MLLIPLVAGWVIPLTGAAHGQSERLTTHPACPVAAGGALRELSGAWQVFAISGLDRARPDSMLARAVIAPDLQGCLLRERLRAQTGSPPYEAVILWGANGADSTIQRVFAHSEHGRIGVYQGRRAGDTIVLRQMPLASQPANMLVENQVRIRDHEHFTITSQLSNDGGRTWQKLSRWEYRRATSSPGAPLRKK